MRYEPTPPWHDEVGRFAQFRISDYKSGVKSGRFQNAPAGLLFRGDSGVPEDGAVADNNNFGGRFGFAYSLTSDGKTSIRGGVGMFYDQHLLGEFNNGGVNGPPWSLRLSVTRPQGPFSDPYRGRTDFNKISVAQIGAADAVFPTPVLATTYDGRQDTPLVQLEHDARTRDLAAMARSRRLRRFRFQLRPARISTQCGSACPRGLDVNN
jgi:hypothetical protein